MRVSIIVIKKGRNLLNKGGKKDMKKVIIACFFSILMLMVPITTASQTANISSTKNTNTENLSNPEFYLLLEQYVALVTYVETNYVGADKDQAYSILNDIIGSNLRVDAIELADAWEEYSYHPIPQEELDEIEHLILKRKK